MVISESPSIDNWSTTVVVGAVNLGFVRCNEHTLIGPLRIIFSPPSDNSLEAFKLSLKRHLHRLPRSQEYGHCTEAGVVTICLLFIALMGKLKICRECNKAGAKPHEYDNLSYIMP